MSLLRWGDEEWFDTFPEVSLPCEYCGDSYEVRMIDDLRHKPKPVCASRRCRERHYREIDKEGGDED